MNNLFYFFSIFFFIFFDFAIFLQTWAIVSTTSLNMFLIQMPVIALRLTFCFCNYLASTWSSAKFLLVVWFLDPLKANFLLRCLIILVWCFGFQKALIDQIEITWFEAPFILLQDLTISFLGPDHFSSELICNQLVVSCLVKCWGLAAESFDFTNFQFRSSYNG